MANNSVGLSWNGNEYLYNFMYVKTYNKPNEIYDIVERFFCNFAYICVL